jgi:hypothetical protein
MQFSQILLCEFAIASNCENECTRKIAKRSQAHFVRSKSMRIRFASQIFAILRVRIANFEPCSQVGSPNHMVHRKPIKCTTF